MNFPTYKSKQNSLCFDRVGPINSLERLTKLAPSNRVVIGANLCKIMSKFPRNCSHYNFEGVQDINRSKKEPCTMQILLVIKRQKKYIAEMQNRVALITYGIDT